MSKVVPNSFQHPNILIDQLAYYLTPEENVVLDKAVREILGWSKRIESRMAPISLSIFVDGKKDRETGEQLCLGCGLGIQAVRAALDGLHKFNILVKVGPSTKNGQEYWLNDDEQTFDWDGLKDRRTKWDESNKSRTEKATEKSIKSRVQSGMINADIHCKKRVLERDQYHCRYCGEPADQIDHIFPQARGGKTTMKNCVAACLDCNSRKQCRTPEEAGMTLLPIPYVRRKTKLPYVGRKESLTSDELNQITSDVNKETQEKPKENKSGYDSDSLSESEIWQQAQTTLELQMTHATFQANFAGVHPMPGDSGTFKLAVPNERMKEVIDNRLRETILGALVGVDPGITGIEVVVE